MSALPQPTSMTETEYLVFERTSDEKHEYLNGEIYAMSGASRAHNLISSYTTAALINSLGDSPCQVYPADMRVKVEASRLYTYPDISIVCGEPQLVDDEFDTLLNPQVIIEVLSPSTEKYDRGEKFQHYRQLPSLREYLLISQDHPRIEHYLLIEDNKWQLIDAIGLDASLELPSIGCTLALSDVYKKVTFEDTHASETT